MKAIWVGLALGTLVLGSLWVLGAKFSCAPRGQHCYKREFYMDLERGSRLSILVPLLKSGGMLPTLEAAAG
jgi:hypothetical protein